MVGVREGCEPRLELDKDQRKLLSWEQKETYNPFVSECHLRLAPGCSFDVTRPYERVFVLGPCCRVRTRRSPYCPFPPWILRRFWHTHSLLKVQGVCCPAEAPAGRELTGQHLLSHLLLLGNRTSNAAIGPLIKRLNPHDVTMRSQSEV